GREIPAGTQDDRTSLPPQVTASPAIGDREHRGGLAELADIHQPGGEVKIGLEGAGIERISLHQRDSLAGQLKSFGQVALVPADSGADSECGEHNDVASAFSSGQD